MNNALKNDAKALQVITCRCGGIAAQPERVAYCSDRWVIRCLVLRCAARNYGQSLASTIAGWNRMSRHYYR
jgi:hypothetical protein